MRPGRDPHRRRPRPRPAGARRLDRRAVRRQRLRHPRHGVERARHVARRRRSPRAHGTEGGHSQPPPAHQRGPPPRLDRRRRRGRLRHRRRDVRVRAARACPSCSAARSATTGPCPTPSPTSSPRPTRMRDARPRRGRGPDAGVDAARHRHRQPPARLASRPSASTSTRPSSPSSPTAAATRPSASSPTSAPSSTTSPTSSPSAGVTTLPWGRRYLMCPPQHFGVLYEINPWMHTEVRVDVDRARAQWEGLAADLRAAGAEVVTIEPGRARARPRLHRQRRPGVGQAVRAVALPPPRAPARDRGASRRGSRPPATSCAGSPRSSTTRAPATPCRSSATTAPGASLLSRLPASAPTPPPDRRCSELARLPGALRRAVDERLYHVDLTFCPLDDRRALCAPLGWDGYGRTVVEALVPEPLWLDRRGGARRSAPTPWSWAEHRDAARARPASAASLEGWGFAAWPVAGVASSSRPAAAAAASPSPSTSPSR